MLLVLFRQSIMVVRLDGLSGGHTKINEYTDKVYGRFLATYGKSEFLAPDVTTRNGFPNALQT